MSLNDELREIFERHIRPRWGNFAALYQTPQHLGQFNIDKMRRMKALSWI
jgi:hypothetical protein